MLQYRTIIILSTCVVFSFVSCSGTKPCAGDQKYTITLSSGGGFTGMAAGVTVDCDGWARFWTRALNSDEHVIDSLRLEDARMAELGKLTDDPRLFSYQCKSTGNFTTFLTIEKGTKFNTISFEGSEPPEDMPPPMKSLISEIKTIRKK